MLSFSYVCKREFTKPCISSAFSVQNEDWEAWERLSRLKGDFLYDSTIQMGHRIHEESETSVIIGDNARSKEDYEMFCKFWPKCIAKFLSNFYAKSEKSNKIN